MRDLAVVAVEPAEGEEAAGWKPLVVVSSSRTLTAGDLVPGPHLPEPGIPISPY